MKYLAHSLWLEQQLYLFAIFQIKNYGGVANIF